MMIVEGIISVKAVLESNKRVIQRLMIQDGKRSKDINYILHLAHTQNIPIEFVSKEIIDSITLGKTHGGVLLEVGSRVYEQLEHSLDSNFMLLLEGIEDPYNLGGVIRTAYIAGCQTILLPYREYVTMEMTILKSSAGYSERLKIVLISDFEDGLKQLKTSGFTIVSALRNEQSINMYDSDLSQNVCICIGGEKRGLSKEVIDQSDIFVEIKYPIAARNALSAFSSANILCFEVVRQRMRGNKHEG